MPYFSVETQPAVPVPGQPARLLVHFWKDQARRTPAPWNGPDVINDLFCVFPAGPVVTGRPGCPGGFTLAVHKKDEATYTATFTMPPTRSSTLVAFPATNRPLPAGYPDEIVLGAGPRSSNGRSDGAGALWFAGGLLALLAVPVLVRERRR